MDIDKQLGLLLVFLIVISRSLSSQSSIHTISAAKEKFRRYEALSDQGLHSTLIGIEDKLRSMDSIRYSMNRWEISLERVNNKIDSIESRTARMQTIFEMKLDALSQAISSSALKHEWLFDQVRKYESNHDRMNLKINSLESKLDDFIRKMQMNQETFLDKMETKHSDLHSKIDNINTISTFIKGQSIAIEDKQNTTHKEIFSTLKNIEDKVGKNEQLEKLTNQLDGIHNHLNQSDAMWAQNDGPRTTEKEKMMDYIKMELNGETQKFGNKLNNMYNEIWKKIANLEILVKDGFVGSNATQKNISDDLQLLMVEQRESERFIDFTVDSIVSIFQNKFGDLQRKMDNEFQNIALLQNLFMETCHRIQEDEPELESKVTKVLEKILDTFLNRTSTIEKQTVDLLELLKSHNSQTLRIGNHNTNMVVRLAEEISEDHKNLDNSIMEVGDRAETITAIMQELQDQILEFNETVAKAIPNITPAINKFMKTVQSAQTEKTEVKTKDDENKRNSDIVHAIEANYGEGVIKILTDGLPTHITSNSKNKTELEDQDLSMKLKFEDWLTSLNKSINTTGLNAIVGTSHKKGATASTEKPEIGGFLLKIQSTHNSTQLANKIGPPEISDEVATQLMLSYIKLIKNRITLSEFLNEKLTGKSYESITDMIQHLKPIKTIPREFIRELDQFDTKLRFENLNENPNLDQINEDDMFNYEDSYDDVVSAT